MTGFRIISISYPLKKCIMIMMNQWRFLSDSDYMIFNNEKHPSLPVLLNKKHVSRFSSALSTTNVAQISFSSVYILTITLNFAVFIALINDAILHINFLNIGFNC